MSRSVAIFSPRKARQLTLVASIMAFFQAGVTGFLAISGWENILPGDYLDVAIVLGLGIGVYRSSRVCAAGLFGYQVSNMIYKSIALGEPPGSFSWSLLVFYGLGVAGALSIPRSRPGGSAQPHGPDAAASQGAARGTAVVSQTDRRNGIAMDTTRITER